MKVASNQKHAHHVSHDWTILVINKWYKKIYSWITEQIQPLKSFMILPVKVKILYIYANVEYANSNAWKSETTFNIYLKNHKKEGKPEKKMSAWKHFNYPYHSFQKHAQFTLIGPISKKTTTKKTRKHSEIQENVWF